MRFFRESLGLAAVVAIGMATAGCDGFFDVDRPNLVDAETLDPAMTASEFSNSAFQNLLVAYGGVIVYGGWFTNEGRVGDTFPTRNEFGRRSLSARNSTLESEVWFPLARAMATSHDALEMLDSTPDKDRSMNVARAAFASGYAVQLMAETFCTGVIEPAGREVGTSEMLAYAAQQLERARDVALAGEAAAAASAKPQFTSLATAAKIALARSYLQAGKTAEAIAEVQGIDDDFVYYARYVNDPAFRGRLGNNVYFFRTNRVSFVVGPEWREMADEGDERISYTLLRNAQGQPLNAQDGELTMYAQTKYPAWDSPIRLASGLEARYIEVEARADLGEMVAFINARRAASGQPGTFATSDAGEAMMELMAQRSRDFWLEGKRLGDWRRHGASEDFPYIMKATGQYYKPDAGAMGGDTCIPLTEFEKDANPNI